MKKIFLCRVSKVRDRQFWKSREAAPRTEIDDFNTARADRSVEIRVLLIDNRQMSQQRMTACGRKEMIISEIDADEPDAARTHVNCEAQSDVGRILRVVKDVRIREIGAAVCAQVESDDILVRETEIELREEIIGFGVFNESEAVAGKLITRVNDDEIFWMELAANVVDADRNESVGLSQFIQRLPTTTHDDG